MPPGETPEEHAELVRFLIENTQNVTAPISIAQLIRIFERQNGRRYSEKCLTKRIQRIRDKIHELDNCDKDAKVKIIFALSGSVSPEFLIELRSYAEVEVDNEQRITKYREINGNLELSGKHKVYPGCYEIKMMEWLAQKSKTLVTPINIETLAKEYKASAKCLPNVIYLEERFRIIRNKIHCFPYYDLASKVRMIFVTSAQIDRNFLNKLRETAKVEVDDQNRITKYTANDGTLTLEGDHSYKPSISEGYSEKFHRMNLVRDINYSLETKSEESHWRYQKLPGTYQKRNSDSDYLETREGSIEKSIKTNRKSEIVITDIDEHKENRQEAGFDGLEQNEIAVENQIESDCEIPNETEDQSIVESVSFLPSFSKQTNIDEDEDGFIEVPMEEGFNHFDSDDDEDSEMKENIQKPATSSLKDFLQHLLSYLVELNSPIMSHVVKNMEGLVRVLGEHDKEVRINVLLDFLESCLSMVMNNAGWNLSEHEESTSLKEFLVSIRTIVCSISHSSLYDFYQKIREFMRELNIQDKKMPSQFDNTKLNFFIVTKGTRADSPINMIDMCEEFNEKSTSLLSVAVLQNAVDLVCKKIQQDIEYDIHTKIKVLFAFKAPVEASFLDELKQHFDVNLDRSNRIVEYKEKEEVIVNRSHDRNSTNLQPEEIYEKMMTFLAELTKTVHSPITVLNFVTKFKEFIGGDCATTKILNERIRKNADVNVDKLRRMTSYKMHGESLVQGNKEVCDFFKFVADKTQTEVITEWSARDYCKEFLGRNCTEKHINYLMRQNKKLGQEILAMSDLDTITKIKMVFALRVNVNFSFLKKLREDADVVLDKKKAIFSYSAHDGSLILEYTGFKRSKTQRNAVGNVIERVQESCSVNGENTGNSSHFSNCRNIDGIGPSTNNRKRTNTLTRSSTEQSTNEQNLAPKVSKGVNNSSNQLTTSSRVPETNQNSESISISIKQEFGSTQHQIEVPINQIVNQRHVVMKEELMDSDPDVIVVGAPSSTVAEFITFIGAFVQTMETGGLSNILLRIKNIKDSAEKSSKKLPIERLLNSVRSFLEIVKTSVDIESPPNQEMVCLGGICDLLRGALCCAQQRSVQKYQEELLTYCKDHNLKDKMVSIESVRTGLNMTLNIVDQ
ncbi:hypothetical protein CRE_08665 [Caenorhabditis remanei]|uniref:SPK domain-containing protein n=1 Tax=Caenorhabditis remanei TaxID=31234 RepID=E3LJ91_CAERE|nr:hypothetical protein CRE_08665 [Caenorhabditis remanei]